MSLHRLHCPTCGDDLPVEVTLVQPRRRTDGRPGPRPEKQATVGAPHSPSTTVQLARLLVGLERDGKLGERWTSADLFHLYGQQALAEGQALMSMTLFVRQLRQMGMRPWRDANRRGLELPQEWRLAQKYRSLMAEQAHREAIAEERFVREAAIAALKPVPEPTDEERIRSEYGPYDPNDAPPPADPSDPWSVA